MITVVVGAPFAGKRLWVDREIEAAESDGTVGTLALDFTSIYSAVVPGLASVYRDQRVSDSGAARFAGWALAAMVREANARELDGYVLTDSPRRAVALAGAAGGAPLVEVVVSQETAHKRSREHVALVRDLAPRAGAGRRQGGRGEVSPDGRSVLPRTGPATGRHAASDRARRAERQRDPLHVERGDPGGEARRHGAKRDKWTRAAAKRALAARGIAA